MTAGCLHGAGRVQSDGGPGLWAVSCGGCSSVHTLPRGLSPEGARATARREGWTYFQPFGWVCPTCRFSWGVAPVPKGERTPARAPQAPWRRVVMNRYRVTDGAGRRLGSFGELLECGHTFIPRDGTPSGNRRRRCLDCLHLGAGKMS